MRRILVLMITATMLLGWGKTGHRVIGKLAEENLTPHAKEAITQLLGNSDLARISNWADEIKADPKWDHSHNWHYCTILDGQTTVESGAKGGYGVQKLNEFIGLLKQGKLSRQDQIDVLRFIVHITGDLHQPLHVGNGSDRGANDVKVTWFGEPTNLHRVWDSQLIDHMQYSYTEYAQQIQLGLTAADKQKLLDPDIMKFVHSSRAAHPQVYDIGDGKLAWKYVYQHRELMENRLLLGGYHLAAILNDIYQ